MVMDIFDVFHFATLWKWNRFWNEMDTRRSNFTCSLFGCAYPPIGSVSHIWDRTRKSLCAIPYYVIQTQCDQRTLRQNAAPLYTKHVTSFFKTSSGSSGHTISRSLVTYLQTLVTTLICSPDGLSYISGEGKVMLISFPDYELKNIPKPLLHLFQNHHHLGDTCDQGCVSGK